MNYSNGNYFNETAIMTYPALAVDCFNFINLVAPHPIIQL